LRDDYRDFFDHYWGYYLCQQYNAGLLTLLALSGVNFAMVDLQFASVEEMLGYPQLWVMGLDFMERAVQEKLMAYVEQGGHLILIPRVPELDENMQPCNLLHQLLPAAPLHPVRGTKWGRMTPSGTVSTVNGCRLAVRDYIDHFRFLDNEQAIAYDQANSLPCAYSRKYGRGQATLVGFKLGYAWDSKLNHSRFVLWLLKKDGIKRSTYSENPEVIVTERAGGEKGFLFVINPTALPQATKIIYTDPRGGVPVSIPQVIENILLPDQGGLALVLNMPLGDLGEILYCTSEILAYQQVRAGEVQLTVQGPSGTWGEVAVRSASKLKCYLPPAVEHSEHEDPAKGVLYVAYRHPEEPVQLTCKLPSRR
jgi:beta-galactosidase